MEMIGATKDEKIAILMATYNGDRFIKKQIESIINQSNGGWHLYIHDDGSKDTTVEMINKCVQCINKKVTLLPGASTGGALYNFMYMLKCVDEEYIMFCDQDDVWNKDKVDKTIKRMKAMERKYGKDTPILVYSDLTVVDSNLRVVSERMSKYQKFNTHKRRAEDFLAENVVTGCTVMINKKLRERALEVKDISNLIMHDWWMVMVAAYFGRIGYINEPLILYRQHDDNSVGAKKMGCSYVVDKIKHLQNAKQSIECTRKQALEFARTYKLNDNSTILKYATVSNKMKISRLCFYIKNHIWKSGVVRNIGFLLLG